MMGVVCCSWYLLFGPPYAPSRGAAVDPVMAVSCEGRMA